jgi:hypothetical protein
MEDAAHLTLEFILSLCGVLLVLQAAISECGSCDPFAFPQDVLGASEGDVSRCEIAQVS